MVKKLTFCQKLLPEILLGLPVEYLWPFKYSSGSGCSFLDFVKCTRTVLVVENLKPFSLHHTSKFRRHKCNFLSIEFRFFDRYEIRKSSMHTEMGRHYVIKNTWLCY